MGMKFKAFTDKTFAATNAAWCEDAAKGGGFLPDIEQTMAWTAGHVTVTDNSIAYGVFDDGDDVAIGICELAITKVTRAKWVKVLRLRLRPLVEGKIFEHDPAGLQAAINAYIACVIGVFHVKNEHKANTIKVYGRTQEQMNFLTLLSSELGKRKEASFESSIEGRWLVLNWSEK